MPSKKFALPVVATAIAASLGLVASAAPSLAARSSSHVIKAQNIAFTPSRLSIRRGESVTWRFLDAAIDSPHTVTSRGRDRFRDSPRPRRSGSFTARFTRPGVYRFMCTVHDSMHGVIVVR